MTDEQKPETGRGNEVNRPMTDKEKEAAKKWVDRFINTHRKTLEKLAK